MLYLIWKTQSSHAAQEEQHETMSAAIQEFKAALEEMHVHGGGMVMICDESDRNTAILKWEEHIEGGYGSGTAWMDVAPQENLNKECVCEDCCWNINEESSLMCEDCERESLVMVIEYLMEQ
jgi:hypothetical protein